MNADQETVFGCIIIGALSFLVPYGLAVGLGYEAEHAALIAWWETLGLWSQVPLALLYGFSGFLVLAAAFAALVAIGVTLFHACKKVTLAVFWAVAFVVETAMKVLLWPVHTIAGRIIRCFSGAPESEYASGQNEEPKWEDVDPFARAPDPLTSAMQLLGLTRPFTKQEFETRYRTLMKGVHPDVAGPNALARQLNEARDVIRKTKAWQ